MRSAVEWRASYVQQSRTYNGLTRRQRTFLLEKLTGRNDKQAALAAGYSPSMAENTKQKIGSKPGVRGEFDSLEVHLRDRYTRALESD
jgi:phage terminase small subunit